MKYKNTVRCPSSEDPDAKSDVVELQKEFISFAPQLRSMVRVLFDGTVTKWADFSNHGLDNSDEQPGNYHSLEYIHDQIHGIIGGNGGQMGNPEVAGYDPIFFFHHCNVDRLLALYESVFGLYVDDKLATKQLIPFRDVEGQNHAWTSKDAHDCSAFGYTYPEMKQTGKELQQSLLSAYKVTVSVANSTPSPIVRTSKSIQLDPLAAAPAAPEPRKNPLRNGLKAVSRGVLNCLGIQVASVAPPAAEPELSNAITPATAGTHHRHVFAHFSVKKNAVSGPFTLKYFVAGQLATQSFVFARVNINTCANCVDLDDLTLGGAADLTSGLQAAGLLDASDSWKSAVEVNAVDRMGRELNLATQLESLKVFLRGAVDRHEGVEGGVGNGTLVHKVWEEGVVQLI
ncbi:hypothetical protein HDU98_003098 [Podochytrium sp. JEL0797]|nr:hypothetical protein HDU98_003098 [Podochytrium sp. JEL0797]